MSEISQELVDRFLAEARNPLTEEQRESGFLVSRNLGDSFHILDNDMLGIRIKFSKAHGAPVLGPETDKGRLLKVVESYPKKPNDDSGFFDMFRERDVFLRSLFHAISLEHAEGPEQVDPVIWHRLNGSNRSNNCWHQDVGFWTLVSSFYGDGIERVDKRIFDTDEARELHFQQGFDEIKEKSRSNVGDIDLLKGKRSFPDVYVNPAPFHTGLDCDRVNLVYFYG